MLAHSAQFCCLSALFVRSSKMESVKHPMKGPSVDISTGWGGPRTSKRGSVSIKFEVDNTKFTVVNLHVKSDTA